MFENSYFKFVAIVKRRLVELNSHAEPTAVVLSEAVPTVKTNVKLPTITLPTFNGQYSQWLQLKDAFLSLIDKNPTLSDIQKLQYLRGTLKNEALQFVEGLETTSENYKTTWELLNNHYENRRLIINTHLKELFKTTSIVKGNRMAIRQFVNQNAYQGVSYIKITSRTMGRNFALSVK